MGSDRRGDEDHSGGGCESCGAQLRKSTLEHEYLQVRYAGQGYR
jgi:hypothetical protein